MSHTSQGLPCPECEFFIPMTIPRLLSPEPIRCPSCGLTLNLDRQKSKKSLEMVQKAYKAMQNAEDTKKRWE